MADSVAKARTFILHYPSYVWAAHSQAHNLATDMQHDIHFSNTIMKNELIIVSVSFFIGRTFFRCFFSPTFSVFAFLWRCQNKCACKKNSQTHFMWQLIYALHSFRLWHPQKTKHSECKLVRLRNYQIAWPQQFEDNIYEENACGWMNCNRLHRDFQASTEKQWNKHTHTLLAKTSLEFYHG